MSQSSGLSKRHTQFHKDGHHLCEDSNDSERQLKEAIKEILNYASTLVEDLGGTIEYRTSISLYECQMAFYEAGGPKPTSQENTKVSMKPDGGIIFAIFDDKKYPIFIGEDKVQGTNDRRLSEGKERQATGNAIERAAKNIRGSEMLCAHMTAFPYVIFASGCDFHQSETIAKRLEMMNMGRPNHYLEITPTSTASKNEMKLKEIIENINVEKILSHGIASVFVKAHKYDVMKHGSSRWKKDEIVKISKRVIYKTLQSIKKILKTEK